MKLHEKIRKICKNFSWKKNGILTTSFGVLTIAQTILLITQTTNHSNASIIANATENERNISDNELTVENLIIDENADNNHEHEHSLACSCTLDKQNLNIKNNKQTPNSK